MIYKITYQDVKTVKSVMRTDDDYKHMYLLEGQIAGFEKEWIDEDIGGIILFQTSNPYWGGIFGLLSGIYTVPGGALLGFIRGKVAEGKAVEYVIGDGEWVIVK